ncbi:hypothetical protein MICRO80W_10109 [Micrococcus luteus]|nr:hypothetical protein MICRO80W_10109 [Micrococcus luteus]
MDSRLQSDNRTVDANTNPSP